MNGQVASIADLPAEIRIFPLDGVVLPPRGVLPLNIFEPRYLAMVRDAMATDRLIGMVQPRGDAQADKPPLYAVGGLGRITQFSDTGDGRFLIALTGLIRFRIIEEVAVATPYRQVRADYSGFAEDWGPAPALSAAERHALEAGMQSYLEAQGLSADWDAVRAADDESLINTLSLVCPFSGGERQALLEAATLSGRADILTTLMALASPGGASPVLQ
jgi:Lon protease-like protein